MRRDEYMKKVTSKSMKKRNANRIAAWILTAALTFSMCPVNVVSAENAGINEASMEESNVEDVEESVDVDAEENVEGNNDEDGVSENVENLDESAKEEKIDTVENEDSLSDETVESDKISKESSDNNQNDGVNKKSSDKESDVAVCDTAENVTKTCPAIGDNGNVTFHYYPESGEVVESAYVKGSWKSDWSEYFHMSEDSDGVWSVTANLSLDNSYEYGIVVNDSWVGDTTNPNKDGNSKILRNPVYNNDGSVKIFYYPVGNEKDVNLLYKTDDASEYTSIDMNYDECHSALLSATITEDGNYTYLFEIDGQEVSDKDCKDPVFAITSVPKDDASVKSPVVDNKEVKFNYYAPMAKKVALAGEMNSWSSEADVMTLDATTGFWSITKTLSAGKYEYKFVVDGNWVTDSRNESSSNGNSVVYLSGLSDATYEIEAGNTLELPNTLKLYDAFGKSSDVEPKYAVEDKYKDMLEIKDGKVEIPSDFAAKKFEIVAEYEEYTSTVTVNVQTNLYNYTIYYYDAANQTKDSASLWVWSDNVNGTQYYFDEEVALDDGNTWLKSTVSVVYEKLYIIPRAYDSWDWQDVDKIFENVDKTKDLSLYMVKGDTKVYTEIPDVNAQKDSRYVIVEYDRPEKDYEGWNIYSWNTGYGSEVVAEFEKIGDKMVAKLPVVDTKESVSFCMRRSTADNSWEEKDGGDHMVAIPLDQTIVKAKFVQGEGIVGNIPYNIGYETNVANQEISFYYRDDKLFRDYELDTLDGKVKLIWDGKKYEMSYDAENERYEYTGKLTDGEHYYAYEVNGELVIDKFNDKVKEVDGITYSLYEYVVFEANVNAKVTPQTIDYNDNAVLSISMSDIEGNEISDIAVKEAYADLSELGLSSEYEISSELMEATIAVKDTIAKGTKNIPISVKDQYGNIYNTSVKINVKERCAGKDFDWDEAVIYFAVTDRFFDGNSSNNDAYGTGTYAPNEGSMYHGGDFAGMKSKLDYLQSLGVNTVWITPVVENIEDVLGCDNYEGQHNSGYHGYWASDFTSLNKHLGTEQEFKALIDEMHRRGMKLMVDVVLNHAGYGTEDTFNNTFLKDKKMLRDSSTTVAGDDQKDALSSLPDFVTEDSEVRDLLIEWQTSWVSKYDIDYFRVDTVKHVDDTTWKAFKNALTYINPDFKMIGEYAGAGYATSAGQLGTGQMDSLLDFDFNDKALAFVNGDISSVESFMESRNTGIDNTATVGSFLGSHDEDGLMYRMINESGKFSKEKAYDLMKVAASLQITAKGQPVIYYGEELGQTGANNWPYQDNRYDLDWSVANKDNDMLSHYKKLLSIRNSYTDVFAKGNRETVAIDDTNDTLVVSRTFNKQTLYIGFNVNQKDGKEVVLDLGVRKNAKFKDLYSGKTYKADKDGKITIMIPAAADGGTVILTQSSNGKADKPQNDKVEKPHVDSSNDNRPEQENKPENNGKNPVISRPGFVGKVELPKYIKIDGTTVRGWMNVIREATKEVIADLVPLSSDVNNARETVVDIVLYENTQKLIPKEVVSEMVANNVTYRFHILKGKTEIVVYEFSNKVLSEVKGALDLNVSMDTTKDFGQGFGSVVINPAIDKSFMSKVTTLVPLGAKKAGRYVFVFQKNMKSNKLEPVSQCKIDKNGNIALIGVDYADLVILY